MGQTLPYAYVWHPDAAPECRSLYLLWCIVGTHLILPSSWIWLFPSLTVYFQYRKTIKNESQTCFDGLRSNQRAYDIVYYSRVDITYFFPTMFACFAIYKATPLRYVTTFLATGSRAPCGYLVLTSGRMAASTASSRSHWWETAS